MYEEGTAEYELQMMGVSPQWLWGDEAEKMVFARKEKAWQRGLEQQPERLSANYPLARLRLV